MRATATLEDLPPAAGARTGLLQGLAPKPADPLLALIAAYQGDTRPGKIDVGVGVYRDQDGRTPVMQAVKRAEERLLHDQDTKAYLGPEGDVGFFDALRRLVLGQAPARDAIAGLQTPGGTGALRLAAELIAAARPGARVLVGTPSWANHAPILKAARLEIAGYRYFDVASQSILFDEMMSALQHAERGDVVLLQACCHNPTGADLDAAQWRAVAEMIARRGLTPLIDLAYHGLACGLDADSTGARLVMQHAGEGLLAYSCDKNFSLYRERTGALFVWTAGRADAALVQSNLLALARANWSMPPDHGAALVRIILEDETLTRLWRDELETMRARIAGLRAALAQADPALTSLAAQRGMFSILKLTESQVAGARERFGIYMVSSGRINVAGLSGNMVERFVTAMRAVRA